MKKLTKLFYRDSNNIFVWQFSKTSNAKISDGSKSIVQTYTFSVEQFNLVKSATNFSMRDFFNLDKSNCLDCPFASNNGCYTHKPIQYMGFKSMLRSLPDSIPYFNDEIYNLILENCTGKYVRFGTYGEPSLLNYNLVSDVCKVAKNWTGYTHQYNKLFAQKFASFFMASTHSMEEVKQAEKLNYRSFLVSNAIDKLTNIVSCPASKEQGYKSTCEKCSLCSGKIGKGKLSVSIIEH